MEPNPDLEKRVFIQETITAEGVLEDFSGRRLLGGVLKSLRFQDGRCRYLRAQDTRLHDVSFDHVLCDAGSFRNCRWEKVHAENSLFTASHFSGCTFEKTAGKLSSFGLSVFSQCRLSESRLSEVSFSGFLWQDCRFEREDYLFVRFPSLVFIDTQFAGCRLQKAIFRAATLFVCNIEQTSLVATLLHSHVLTG